MTTQPHHRSGAPQHAHGGRWSRTRRAGAVLAVLAMLLAGIASPADAYIGPGAGFALLSSFLVLFTTIVARDRLAAVLAVPHGSGGGCAADAPPRARIRRLVIVGLDGQDPTLTDRFMDEGLLPNFTTLATPGSYRRLTTTFPSMSPVAWSSFSTGAPSRRGTTSSTSSIAIGAPTCRCSRRRASARSSASSSSAATAFRCEKPELRLLRQVEAVLDHPRRAPHLEHRSCACRSRSRPTASTARS